MKKITNLALVIVAFIINFQGQSQVTRHRGTLELIGLQEGAETDRILIIDEDDTVRYKPASALPVSEQPVSVSNGLQVNTESGDIELGAPLEKQTEFDLNNQAITLTDSNNSAYGVTFHNTNTSFFGTNTVTVSANDFIGLTTAGTLSATGQEGIHLGSTNLVNASTFTSTNSGGLILNALDADYEGENINLLQTNSAKAYRYHVPDGETVSVVDDNDIPNAKWVLDEIALSSGGASLDFGNGLTNNQNTRVVGLGGSLSQAAEIDLNNQAIVLNDSNNSAYNVVFHSTATNITGINTLNINANDFIGLTTSGTLTASSQGGIFLSSNDQVSPSTFTNINSGGLVLNATDTHGEDSINLLLNSNKKAFRYNQEPIFSDPLDVATIGHIENYYNFNNGIVRDPNGFVGLGNDTLVNDIDWSLINGASFTVGTFSLNETVLSYTGSEVDIGVADFRINSSPIIGNELEVNASGLVTSNMPLTTIINSGNGQILVTKDYVDNQIVANTSDGNSSDISGLLPYTGATQHVDLGENNLVLDEFIVDTNDSSVGISTTSLDLQPNSVLIGLNAGIRSDVSSAILLGTLAGDGSSAANINAFGHFSGTNSQGRDLNLFGINAGTDSLGDSLNALGGGAGSNSDGNNLNFLGDGAGGNSNGFNQNGFGFNSARGSVGSNNNFIGSISGDGNTGDNNNGLGSGALQDNKANNVTGIGNGAGEGNTISNTLIFGPNAISVFADRETALSSYTSENGANSGDYYIYLNSSTNALEFIQP